MIRDVHSRRKHRPEDGQPDGPDFLLNFFPLATGQRWCFHCGGGFARVRPCIAFVFLPLGSSENCPSISANGPLPASPAAILAAPPGPGWRPAFFRRPFPSESLEHLNPDRSPARGFKQSHRPRHEQGAARPKDRPKDDQRNIFGKGCEVHTFEGGCQIMDSGTGGAADSCEWSPPSIPVFLACRGFSRERTHRGIRGIRASSPAHRRGC